MHVLVLYSSFEQSRELFYLSLLRSSQPRGHRCTRRNEHGELYMQFFHVPDCIKPWQGSNKYLPLIGNMFRLFACVFNNEENTVKFVLYSLIQQKYCKEIIYLWSFSRNVFKPPVLTQIFVSL